HPNQKVQMQSNKLHLSPKELLAQGIRARKFVEKLTDHSREIYLEFDNARYDKYQRLLAYAYLRDGRMINEEVLKAGFAMVLEIRPNTRYHEKFAYALSDAKKKRLGLWQN
ncbi:MAG: thermonuclease family protein, partial [Bdellovibrionales bacterium]|nr:thermonuclease family protein [Bdellovibrionales bacterium]